MKKVTFTAKIILVFISFYAIVYMFGFYSYYLAFGVSPDRDKTVSGLYIGFLVSTVPYWFISRKLVNTYKNSALQAVLTLFLISFLLEKFLLVLIGHIFAFDEGQNSFLVLSETLPYFIYKEYYIVASTLLSAIIIFIVVKLKH